MLGLALVLVATATAVSAQPGARSLGKWSDWEVLTSQEAGAAVCYALSRPFSSIPSVEGRGEPRLAFVKRPGAPDMVALTGEPVSSAGTTAELKMGSEFFPLDRGPDGAYLRGGPAIITAMERELQAVATFAGPQGARATDAYSLRGFRAAYGAMRQVCPAQ